MPQQQQDLDQHSYKESVLSTIISKSNKTYTYNYKSLININWKHISRGMKTAVNAESSKGIKSRRRGKDSTGIDANTGKSNIINDFMNVHVDVGGTNNDIIDSTDLLPAEVSKSNLKLRAVTIEEVLERFIPKSSESCLNSCEVNPESRPRSNAEDADNDQDSNTAKNVIPGCDVRTIEGWRNALRNGDIFGIPLYSADEFMFPFEHRLFSRPRLTNLTGLPDLKSSTIYHITYSGSSSSSRSKRSEGRNGTGIHINLDNDHEKGNNY